MVKIYPRGWGAEIVVNTGARVARLYVVHGQKVKVTVDFSQLVDTGWEKVLVVGRRIKAGQADAHLKSVSWRKEKDVPAKLVYEFEPALADERVSAFIRYLEE